MTYSCARVPVAAVALVDVPDGGPEHDRLVGAGCRVGEPEGREPPARLRAVDRPMFGAHFDPVNLIMTPRVYWSNGALIRESDPSLYLFSSDYPHAEGTFVISRVPAGGMTLRVQRIGYQPVSRALTLDANDTVNVRIRSLPLGDEERSGK